MLPKSSNYVMKIVNWNFCKLVLLFFRPIAWVKKFLNFYFCEVSDFSVFVEMESVRGFLTSFLEVDISKGCLGCIIKPKIRFSELI